jgi:hypothetical protein
VISVLPADLLHFFDEVPSNSRGHATAIVAVAGEELGVALLLHYLRSAGHKAAALSGPCTSGRRKGKRLDRWIEISAPSRLLYQVEVKNWSAHAIGGTRLSINAPLPERRKYAREKWTSFWNGKTFRTANMRKVLLPMKPPMPGVRVEPVICFWLYCGVKPFFTVSTNAKAAFRRVHVFSMSSYLRSCAKRALRLEMPHSLERLSWLRRLFRRAV